MRRRIMKGEGLNDLVIRKGKEVFTDSLVISEGTGIRHDKLKESIRKNQKSIERFGKLSTSYGGESTGGRRAEIYQLNEEQATFLITLLKNTEIVINFKVELVKQFYAMRRLLQEQQSIEWKYFRGQGKSVRLAETEILKELVEYAKVRGSTNSNKIYSNYTKLANKTVGIKSVKDATTTQLNLLMLVENIFQQIIQSGMETDSDYHDIYRNCKLKAEQLYNAVSVGITA